MDLEKYAERILSLPTDRLHILVEADPEAALLWSERVQILADTYAFGAGITPDAAKRDQLLRRLTHTLFEAGGAQDRSGERCR